MSTTTTKPANQVTHHTHFSACNGVDQLHVLAVGDRVFTARVTPSGGITIELTQVPADVALCVLQELSQCPGK